MILYDKISYSVQINFEFVCTYHKPMVLYQQWPGCPDVFLNGTTQQWCLPTPKLRCSDSVERVESHIS